MELIFLVVISAELLLIAYWIVRAAPAPPPVQPSAASANPATEPLARPMEVPSGFVQLLYLGNEQWNHHSYRPEGHRDIEEALRTPGMAVHRPGVGLEVNRQ